MSCLLTVARMAIVLLGIATWSEGQDRTAINVLSPKNQECSLVSASVSSVFTDSDVISYTFQISHVYCGGAELGKSFAVVVTSRPLRSARFVVPRLKVGARSIWTVIGKGDDVYSPASVGDFLVLYPLFEKSSPRYEEAEKLAEFVEKVDKLRMDERAAAILNGVRSEIPEIASWSVYLLNRSVRAEVQKLGGEIARSAQFPVACQTGVDRSLVIGDGADSWRTSADRGVLLDRWASLSAVTEYDGWLIVEHLDATSQLLPANDGVVRCLSKVARNAAFSLSARRHAVRSIGIVATREGDNPAREALVSLRTELGDMQLLEVVDHWLRQPREKWTQPR